MSKRIYPKYEEQTLFQMDDRVEMFIPDKGYSYGTIVDKIPSKRKPDLFLIQKWKLFKLPLTIGQYPRWVVKMDNSEHCNVFPDVPQRVMHNRIYLKGDVTVTRLQPEIVKPEHPHMLHL